MSKKIQGTPIPPKARAQIEWAKTAILHALDKAPIDTDPSNIILALMEVMGMGLITLRAPLELVEAQFKQFLKQYPEMLRINSEDEE